MKVFVALFVFFVFAGCGEPDGSDKQNIEKNDASPDFTDDNINESGEDNEENQDIEKNDSDEDFFELPDFTGNSEENSDLDLKPVEDPVLIDFDCSFDVEFKECSKYKRPVSTVTLKNPDLMEISGVAVSYINPGILWVHNDSGGEPALFAIRYDGSIAAKLTLVGIENIDWEDITLAHCGCFECFYIGDIGDNLLKRDDYSIITVLEPILPQNSSNLELSTEYWIRFPISYEGTPHMNSEAMAADHNGSMYIFSKEIGITNVYKADISDLNMVGTEFKFIGSIETGKYVTGYPDIAQPSLVTAADIHRNGTRLLLRTYGIITSEDDSIREFYFEKGNVEEIFSQTPEMVPKGREIQGEAIGYNPFTGGYVHISEYYKKGIEFFPDIWVVECND
ncbi:MAG: hypothetical protein ACOX2F_06525 [bacterium]